MAIVTVNFTVFCIHIYHKKQFTIAICSGVAFGQYLLFLSCQHTLLANDKSLLMGAQRKHHHLSSLVRRFCLSKNLFRRCFTTKTFLSTLLNSLKMSSKIRIPGCCCLLLPEMDQSRAVIHICEANKSSDIFLVQRKCNAAHS